ncbi:PHM/PNGase F domain-containing protein [Obelidium mucronatum]|nr:PHM/PNGase F domain-containing protein [Obelidium mucronatum]
MAILFKSESKLQSTTTTLKQLDIVFPTITIPSNQTSYLCTHIEVPSDQKYHVVQYSPLLKSNLVHHMILYGCKNAPASFGEIFECESMQPDCSTFTLAWAPGIDLNVYPPEAGFAIGVGLNAFRYFALQIHYNNQNQLSNVKDSSGLRLDYTNELRPNDIGVLILGSEDINIPGNSPNYTSTPWNVCPSDCTKKFPSALNVISNGFHMHTLGHNSTTRHIRNGKELDPLGVVGNYNFL